MKTITFVLVTWVCCWMRTKNNCFSQKILYNHPSYPNMFYKSFTKKKNTFFLAPLSPAFSTHLPFFPHCLPRDIFSNCSYHIFVPLSYLVLYLIIYLCIFSSLSLFVCLCVTVWRFVLCSVHAIPGSRPDGPRLRRNDKGPRNPISISIK